MTKPADIARENAREKNGEFGTQLLDESNVALAERPDTEANRAEKHISPHTMVYFVDRDDRLNDEEIDHLLSGDEMAAYNSSAARFDDSAYEYATEEARQAWERALDAGDVETEWDELDDELQDEFRWAVMNRDTTDLVAELASNTPKTLMRTHLADNLGARLDAAPAGTWHGLSTFNEDGPEAEARQAARYAVVENILAEHGVGSSDEVREAVRELVDNGPYDWHEGVDLDVIFYDDVKTAAADPAPGSTTSLTFTDAHVVLIDTFNGSGHDVRIPGTLTRTFAAVGEEGGLDAEDRAFADAGPSSRMSWDDVCGLHKPAYKTSVTRTVAGTEGAAT